MKRIATIVFAAVLSVSLMACTKKDDKSAKMTNEKVNVVVSFNPLKEFTEAIGGEKVDVKSLVPEGSEPHDFEPKTKDLTNLSKSDMFVYNGLGMEDWADKVIDSVKNNVKEIVDASKGCNIIKTEGKIDPHIWLSLNEAKNECLNIKNSLIKLDEKNKDYYNKNYESYIKQLDDLYNQNKERFKELKVKDFVTGHEAFGYLCRDFELKQKSVEDVFGEGEVTPQKLKELTDYCKQYNIKTIFMESLASPKVSETLANEVGAKIEKIYTIESKEDNKSYIESMKYNLDKIYDSLK